ncbi:MAG: sulfatase-like hydrolase/transferase, partial [Roseicyclus sp.]
FVLPLELPVILGGLLALGPGRAATAVRAILVTALMLIAVLKIADYAMFTALGRGFNPVADLPLAEAGVRLLHGAVGPALTIVALAAALVAVVFASWLLWWATGVWAQVEVGRRAARVMATVAALFGGIAIAEIGAAMGRWNLPVAPPGAAFTARVGVERIVMARDTFAKLWEFAAAAADDPYSDLEGLLDRIDSDVLVIFVESYGRTSLDTPFHAKTHRATLAAAEARLQDLGLSMRSGLLRAPTRGGQSWLSHATFANGLWIDNQTSYGAALASGRETLFHIARRSGFRTAAVMPQITLDWPESSFMGFETVLASDDLGYEGLPFNWVTMPDQFTLTALDRLLRDGSDPRPLFAQIALGSSHAPWVPVPELIAWESVGDGRIFDGMARSGDPPEVVWSDPDRVREQYRKAIDYALRTVFDYAARHAAEPPLMIVIGDHRAAGFVALDERPDVPVHVIGPGHLVSPAADWGWQAGLIPDTGGAVRSMDRMRDLILEAYSSRGAEGTGS